MNYCSISFLFNYSLEKSSAHKDRQEIDSWLSVDGATCCVKVVLPPGIGKLDGAMGRRSRGEPVLFLLSVRE